MCKAFTLPLTGYLMKGGKEHHQIEPTVTPGSCFFTGFDGWWQFKSTSISLITFLMMKSSLHAPSTQLHWIYRYALSRQEEQNAGSFIWMQRVQLHTPWLTTTSEQYLYSFDKQKSRLSKTDIQIKKSNYNRCVPENALGGCPMVFHDQI